MSPTCAASTTILSPSILWELKRQGIPRGLSPERFQAIVPNLQSGPPTDTPASCASTAAFHPRRHKRVLRRPRVRARRFLPPKPTCTSGWARYEHCVDLFSGSQRIPCAKKLCAGRVSRRSASEVLASFSGLSPATNNSPPDEGYVALTSAGSSAEKRREMNLLRRHGRDCLTFRWLSRGTVRKRPRLEALAKEIELEPSLVRGHGARRRN